MAVPCGQDQSQDQEASSKVFLSHTGHIFPPFVPSPQHRAHSEQTSVSVSRRTTLLILLGHTGGKSPSNRIGSFYPGQRVSTSHGKVELH